MEKDTQDKQRALSSSSLGTLFIRYAWILFATIHFIASFFYERKILKFSDTSWDFFWSIALDDRVSNRQQSMILYFFSKIVAAVLISLMWYLIFKAVNRKIPIHILAMFGFIVVALGIYYCAFWPGIVNWKDSLLVYSFSVRLIATYWHHYLTSALYAGCLMVLPHSIAVYLWQFISFALVMVYIYYRLEKCFTLPVWLKLLVFLVYVSPDTFNLVSWLYRNCSYTITLLFYVAFLMFENYENAQVNKKKLIFIVLMSALLSVWRTEGILVGLCGCLLCLFKIYKKVEKKYIWIIAYVAVMVVLSIPQKIGEQKYYGKDYLITSTTETLMNTLNSKSANLNYNGAGEDIEAISEYVPVEYIKCNGMNGVRAYNNAYVGADFNQSAASKEVQDAYLKAFVRIVLHNPDIYIKTQVNMMLDSLEIPVSFQMDGYEGSMVKEEFDYSISDTGVADIYSSRMVYTVVNNKAFQTLSGAAGTFNVAFNKLVKSLRIPYIIRILIIIGDVIIAVRGYIKLFTKKKCNVVCMCLATLFLIQFFIITFTMPNVLSLYFYSVLYPMLLLEALCVFEKVSRNLSGKPVNNKSQ